jgi:hypothetical protein
MDAWLKEMKAGQERTDASLKEVKAGQEHLKEERMASLKTQIGCLTTCIDVNQEKVDAWLEEVKAWRKEKTASRNWWRPTWRRTQPKLRW